MCDPDDCRDFGEYAQLTADVVRSLWRAYGVFVHDAPAVEARALAENKPVEAILAGVVLQSMGFSKGRFEPRADGAIPVLNAVMQSLHEAYGDRPVTDAAYWKDYELEEHPQYEHIYKKFAELKPTHGAFTWAHLAETGDYCPKRCAHGMWHELWHPERHQAYCNHAMGVVGAVLAAPVLAVGDLVEGLGRMAIGGGARGKGIGRRNRLVQQPEVIAEWRARFDAGGSAGRYNTINELCAVYWHKASGFPKNPPDVPWFVILATFGRRRALVAVNDEETRNLVDGVTQNGVEAGWFGKYPAMFQDEEAAEVLGGP